MSARQVALWIATPGGIDGWQTGVEVIGLFFSDLLSTDCSRCQKILILIVCVGFDIFPGRDITMWTYWYFKI